MAADQPRHRVSNGAIVIAAKDHLSCSVAEEVVLLQLKSGMYYGLNEMGARIWNLLREPRTVEQIRAVILGEYAVEPDRFDNDLMNWFQQMADEKLIEIKDEAAS